MRVTLELDSELGIALQAAAALRRQDPATFAVNAIAAAVREPGEPQNEISDRDFEAALGELEAIGAGIPASPVGMTHSREDIYCDHD